MPGISSFIYIYLVHFRKEYCTTKGRNSSHFSEYLHLFFGVRFPLIICLTEGSRRYINKSGIILKNYDMFLYFRTYFILLSIIAHVRNLYTVIPLSIFWIWYCFRVDILVLGFFAMTALCYDGLTNYFFLIIEILKQSNLKTQDTINMLKQYFTSFVIWVTSHLHLQHIEEHSTQLEE